MKSCCFIGHRHINITADLKERLEEMIIDLINNHNVTNFLFGSNSEFNTLCHEIVTKLKESYSNIIRIVYTCASETCTYESEREKQEETYSILFKKTIHLLGFEEEREYKTKYTAGKASYVKRNQAMINDSNYCVFYYDEKYEPELRKYSKNSIGYYQPNSGTKLAYSYAKSKRKIIYNIKNLLKI